MLHARQLPRRQLVSLTAVVAACRSARSCSLPSTQVVSRLRPRIREQSDQPRPQIVSEKHHAASLPAHGPIRRISQGCDW